MTLSKDTYCLSIAFAAWLASVSMTPSSNAFILPSFSLSSMMLRTTDHHASSRRVTIPSVDNNHNNFVNQKPRRHGPPAAAAEGRVGGSIQPEYYSFDDMKAMESRLGNLEKEAPEILAAFYEPHLKSFSMQPGSVKVSSI